jgi:hypothetical protein
VIYIDNYNMSSNRIHEKGYFIYRTACPEIASPRIVRFMKHIAQTHSKPVLNDDKRRRVILKPQCNLNVATWMCHLESAIRALHPIDELHFSEWNILHTLPGCKRQPARIDYGPDETFINKMVELDSIEHRDKIPLICVVALETNTYLDVWEYSIRTATQSEETLRELLNPGIERVRLVLQPGDILIFRPDLVHAGSDYENENVCLHVYLDSPEIPRTPNRTFIIHKHGGEWLRAMFSRHT